MWTYALSNLLPCCFTTAWALNKSPGAVGWKQIKGFCLLGWICPGKDPGSCASTCESTDKEILCGFGVRGKGWGKRLFGNLCRLPNETVSIITNGGKFPFLGLTSLLRIQQTGISLLMKFTKKVSNFYLGQSIPLHLFFQYDFICHFFLHILLSGVMFCYWRSVL